MTEEIWVNLAYARRGMLEDIYLPGDAPPPQEGEGDAPAEEEDLGRADDRPSRPA